MCRPRAVDPTQHSPAFRQRRSEPVVARGRAETTVISWVAEPVSASWFARFAGHVDARASLLPLAAAEQSKTRAESAIPQRIPPAEYARGAMTTLILAIFAAVSLQAPPFSHSVSRVTAAQLPYSWHRAVRCRPPGYGV
jgi:hypothetical protein